MLDLVRSSNFNLNMFHIPRVPNASYLMSVSAVGKNIYNSKKPTTYTSRKAPVKAATHISEGSKTDVIEVSSLVEKSSPHIKYVSQINFIIQNIKFFFHLQIINFEKFFFENTKI